MRRESNRQKRLTWVYITGAAFVVFLLIAAFFLFFADKLLSLNIVGSMYYIVLIPVALGAAAFLFGAMQSYARYNGKNSYGSLQLTGPVVLFALVMLGGFTIPKNELATFSLTVRVYGSADKMDIINTGIVRLNLGQGGGAEQIKDGKVVFAEIPSTFRSKPVDIIAIVDQYKPAYQNPIIIPATDNVVELQMERVLDSTVVRGTVVDNLGKPAKNVLLNFASGLAKGYTDEYGNFKIVVPNPDGTILPLVIMESDDIKFNERVTISEHPLTLRLN